jgi:hypothetical protein
MGPVERKLRAAHKLLEEGGWTRYNLCADGKHCAIGAVSEVCKVVDAAGVDYPNTTEWRNKPEGMLALACLRFLRKAAGLKLGDRSPCEAIYSHNDLCITSFDEALDWFKRAIELARKAGA